MTNNLRHQPLAFNCEVFRSKTFHITEIGFTASFWPEIYYMKMQLDPRKHMSETEWKDHFVHFSIVHSSRKLPGDRISASLHFS